MDTGDCDNYAFDFASMSSRLLRLNSAAIVGTKVYNKNTGKFINYHVCILIIALINKQLTPVLFETQNDGYTIYKEDCIIKDWIYKGKIRYLYLF